MPPCVYCNAIAEIVRGPLLEHGDERFVWNYWAVQRNRKCATCRKIIQYFDVLRSSSSWNPTQEAYVRRARYDPCWEVFLKHTEPPQDDVAGQCIQLLRIGSDEEPDIANAIGVAVDEPLINLSRVRKWITKCDQLHTGVCHSIDDPWQKIQPATGLLFIDVERRCLVRQPIPPEDYRYVTLSYVWGTAINPARTTSLNFDQLCQDGSFDYLLKISLLPKTIEHCMILTRALGVRYLWVDRFCLIQDDPGISVHLRAMASIYSNSYITIAATEGDNDNFGIPGLASDLPRRIPFRRFDFGSGCRMLDTEYTAYVSWENSVYHSRGWTFQEWALSHRLLIFHDQTVSWLCHKHTEQENGNPLSLAIQPARLKLSEVWTQKSKIFRLQKMIEEYTRRKLSDPNDIITAFSAVITVQGRRMLGGIFHGIPELYFGTMLHWSSDGMLLRRTHSSGAISKRYPSWSWTGWIGPTSMAMPISFCSDRAWTGITYTHLVDFSKALLSPELQTKEAIRELHSYQKKPENQQEPSDVVPQTEILQYAIPLVESPTDVALHTESLYSTILECRTEKAYLYLRGGKDKHKSRNSSASNGSCVLNASGFIIGMLGTTEPHSHGDIPQEFIRISAGQCEPKPSWKYSRLYLYASLWDLVHKNCYGDCFQDRRFCREKKHWPMRVYNVLWIEWKDGVAYRKALGTVLQDAWKAADTEEIDIRLG